MSLRIKFQTKSSDRLVSLSKGFAKNHFSERIELGWTAGDSSIIETFAVDLSLHNLLIVRIIFPILLATSFCVNTPSSMPTQRMRILIS